MSQKAVYTDILTIAAGGNGDLAPPAGYDMEVTLIGSSAWAGVVPNQRPDVNVGLYDGAIGPSHIQRATDLRGWMRRGSIFINPSCYLRFNNPGLAPANIAHSARLIRKFGSGVSAVKSTIATVAAGATLAIRPPANEDWMVTDFSSNQWLGAAPGGLPNLTVQLTNGVIAADILRPTETRLWCPALKLYVNNTWYILVTNSAGVPAVVGYSAQLIRRHGTSIVKSSVQAIAAGLGSVDFRPAAGEEWYGEVIGSGTWVGVSPGALPDVTAHIWDGTVASQIMSQINLILHENEHEFMIDHDNYVRVTDTSGAVQNVAINAVLTNRYAS